ncbi:DUF350 domain-containing protein [uncultured Veillonella sp.]|uniref:DUF350 domain-containing protein n=1 Tax=uncultured Veillonella sp. TaxID=159268 RepID=UPI0026090138|nr:DUF350 domain-containing protein [uncultured Veillonella sp.]
MPYIVDIINVVVFSLIGIILMIIGNWIIDVFIPGDFPTEIKRGNRAVAWLCAGSFIGIGEIVRAAIQSPSAQAVEEYLLQGLVSSLLYSVIGIAIFLVGFFLVNAFHRKYSLAEEIMRGNTAAGIMIFGIFVGCALIIAGAIH